jgi:hypothetical protein
MLYYLWKFLGYPIDQTEENKTIEEHDHDQITNKNDQINQNEAKSEWDILDEKEQPLLKHQENKNIQTDTTHTNNYKNNNKKNKKNKKKYKAD